MYYIVRYRKSVVCSLHVQADSMDDALANVIQYERIRPSALVGVAPDFKRERAEHRMRALLPETEIDPDVPFIRLRIKQ